MYLNHYDMRFCVRKLPKRLKMLLMKYGEQIVVAGGYIRAVIANELVSDIDIFAGDRKVSEDYSWELAQSKLNLYFTDNAITVTSLRIPIQFIYRWVYDNPVDMLKSFDFSICQAAIWYDKKSGKWSSQCGDRFYQDLAAKRLIYLSPTRNKDAGGSLLRILKYYQRGYRIPLDSFGAVLARLFGSIKWDSAMAELDIAKLITGLLIEVDPAGFIDHEAYLPAEQKETEGKS